MFRRIDNNLIADKKKYKQDLNYLKALSLYMKSYEFEVMGDTKKLFSFSNLTIVVLQSIISKR